MEEGEWRLRAVVEKRNGKWICLKVEEIQKTKKRQEITS